VRKNVTQRRPSQPVESEHGYEKEIQEERSEARAAVTAEEEVREKEPDLFS
jgi:hypothetical protein